MVVEEDATQATSELKKVGVEAPQPPSQTFTINTAEIEAARRAQWKGAVQQELQVLVQQASEMRKKINEAKTSTKKQFYTKKFAKIQPKVMQMVAALQRLEMQEKAAAGAAAVPHVHDENCQHDHHEEEHTNESPPTKEAS